MTTLEVLKRAKNCLKRRKLCKGRFTDGKLLPMGKIVRPSQYKACCAEGAIYLARGWYDGGLVPEHYRATAALCRCLNGAGLWAINDDPKTTKADVMALFDKAIARLEAEGKQ